jgi:hypothetical protein
LERHSHFGCAWIVDQLIGIRDQEKQLAEEFASGDGRSSIRLRLGVAELNRRLEMLDQALDLYPPVLQEQEQPMALMANG